MSTTSKRASLGVAAGAAFLVISACGSSGGSGGGSNNGNGSPSTTGTNNETVAVLRGTSLGDILVDSSGRTVYMLTADAGKLACTGGCLSVWPPVLVPKGSTPHGATGVTGSLGVVKRGNQQQVTIAGHPLYTYSGDTGPGGSLGQGFQSFGGTWYVLAASGNPVTGPSVGSSGSGTSGGSSSPSANPYGY